MIKAQVGFVDVQDSDVRIASQSLGWQIQNYNFPDIWMNTQGEDVKVAIIDTGIDPLHEDLQVEAALDFVGSANGDLLDPETTLEPHGTHVAGIVGARNNEKGVVGVAPKCKLYSCRVFPIGSGASLNDIIKALQWCIDNKMDVVNMSLGALGTTDGFYQVIRAAYDVGLPIVCAAGNDGWSIQYLQYPANFDETISVAAFNSSMTRASFSSIGANIDIAAPGEGIHSTIPDNGYAIMSGTSMAAPFVTGLVALIISKHRKLGGKTPVNNVEDIRNHLTKIAFDVDFEGQDLYLGHGLINPVSSLGLVDQEIKKQNSYIGVYGGSQFKAGIIGSWND